MIDTEVAGDPDAVEAAARWLRGSLSAGTAEAAELTVRARAGARRDWAGSTAESYEALARETLVLTDAHAACVVQAAGVVEAYAVHLRGVQQHLAGIRAEAVRGGLGLDGFLVLPPGPGLGPDAHALFERVARAVATELERHARWVADHLEGAADAAAGDGRAAAVVGFLRAHLVSFGLSTGLGFGEGRLALGADTLAASAARARADAATLRGARRSGHPGRRAAGRAPAAREQVRVWERAAEEAVEHAHWMRYGGKLLGPAGLGFDAYFGYREIRGGASPTGVLLSTVASNAAAAGVVAAAPVAAAGTPALATAAAAGAVAVAAGALAEAGWNALPEGATDTVDDGLDAGWHGVEGWW